MVETAWADINLSREPSLFTEGVQPVHDILKLRIGYHHGHAYAAVKGAQEVLFRNISLALDNAKNRGDRPGLLVDHRLYTLREHAGQIFG